MSVSEEARTAQIYQALASANKVRLERARLLGGLGRGGGGKIPRDRVADLLLAPPEVLLGMRIDRLLVRVERYRGTRVARLLREERISETRLVRELTDRQRACVAERLRAGR